MTEMSTGHSLKSKDELRAHCRRFRKSLDTAAYTSRSRAIVDRAWSGGLFNDAGIVHVYWPIETRREIDTRPLITLLQESGKTVLIPTVNPAADAAPGSMIFRPFLSLDAMQENEWGTYEPLGDALVPETPDLIVVPAFAADREGYRLGYGGGYYDRFLKDAGCTAVTLVYSECLFSRLPREAHDVPVQVVVTEEETVRPGPPATW